MPTMRKLAREAVIFMLVAAVLSGVGTFVFESYESFHSIQTQRTELKKECDAVKDKTTVQLVGKCVAAFGQLGGQTVPDAFGSDKLSGERLDDYNKGRDYGLWLKTAHVYYADNAYLSVVVAGIGFLAGLVLWLLFRLVVFAIKG
jgi:hypothetical protein